MKLKLFVKHDTVPDYRLFLDIITFHKVVWGRLRDGDVIFVSRLLLSPLVKEV